jgi:hypothetical protein
MKIVFSAQELSWLHYIINKLLVIVAKSKEKDAVKTLRTLKKMQYKFSPNASYVQLTQKEIRLLLSVVNHRMDMLKQEPMQLSEELQVVGPLFDKLSEDAA